MAFSKPYPIAEGEALRFESESFRKHRKAPRTNVETMKITEQAQQR